MLLGYGRVINLFSHGVYIRIFRGTSGQVIKLGECVADISLSEVIKYMSIIQSRIP